MNTIDVIGVQTEIMDKIIDKAGHFYLQLKKNQRVALEDVELFLRDMEENDSELFTATDVYSEVRKDQGRIEKNNTAIYGK